MKFTEWFGPILLVLVLANMVFAQDNSADRAAIQGVVASFMDAWNKHDARAFSMVFAEDADFTNVRGVGTSGRESIEKFHEPGFKSGFRNSHLTTSEIKFRLIRPDVASVDVRWEMTGALGCGQQTDSAAQRAPEFHHDQRN